MDDKLNEAIDALKSFHQKYKDSTGKEYDISKAYLEWVRKKTLIVKEEKNFVVPDNAYLRRGGVFWAELGHNIGEEYGGHHPVLILKKGREKVIVVPISSKEPTKAQKDSGHYVQLETLKGGFKDDRQRWVNVLNTTPISMQRLEITGTTGFVGGKDLDNLKEAMKKTRLWG